MPTPEAWQAFAGLGAVIIFLGAVFFGLQRLGLIKPKAATPAAPASAPPADKEPGLAEKVAALERELAALRLHVAEHYVRRDDYITNQSRVVGMLEHHGVMLARLEERMGAMK